MKTHKYVCVVCNKEKICTIRGCDGYCVKMCVSCCRLGGPKK